VEVNGITYVRQCGRPLRQSVADFERQARRIHRRDLRAKLKRLQVEAAKA